MHFIWHWTCSLIPSRYPTLDALLEMIDSDKEKTLKIIIINVIQNMHWVRALN